MQGIAHLSMESLLRPILQGVSRLNEQTLSILIVAAVIQGEFYERRFGGGPKHLDMSLALPQGIIRGTLTAGLLIGFAWSWDSHQSWGVLLLLGMLTAWSAYGVYRTILQATTPPADIDLV